MDSSVVVLDLGFFLPGAVLPQKNTSVQNNHLRFYTMTSKNMVRSYYCLIVLSSRQVNIYFTLHITDVECYTDSPRGTDYRGYVNRSKSGKTCQKWTSHVPHEHPIPPNLPGTGLGDHKYCRNPNNASEGPWCFTTDRDTRYEFCEVESPSPTCSSVGMLISRVRLSPSYRHF